MGAVLCTVISQGVAAGRKTYYFGSLDKRALLIPYNFVLYWDCVFITAPDVNGVFELTASVLLGVFFFSLALSLSLPAPPPLGGGGWGVITGSKPAAPKQTTGT